MTLTTFWTWVLVGGAVVSVYVAGFLFFRGAHVLDERMERMDERWLRRWHDQNPRP